MSARMRAPASPQACRTQSGLSNSAIGARRCGAQLRQCETPAIAAAITMPLSF
jgi:hypothetical protein